MQESTLQGSHTWHIGLASRLICIIPNSPKYDRKRNDNQNSNFRMCVLPYITVIERKPFQQKKSVRVYNLACRYWFPDAKSHMLDDLREIPLVVNVNGNKESSVAL